MGTERAAGTFRCWGDDGTYDSYSPDRHRALGATFRASHLGSCGIQVAKGAWVEREDRTLPRIRAPRGLTLVELLLAITILAIGLLGILTAFPTSYLDVVGSGAQSKAVSYARQQIEILKNQPFTAGPVNPTNMTGLESGYTGTWRIDAAAGTVAPNRLVRITVSMTYKTGGAGRQAKTVSLETLRAE